MSKHIMMDEQTYKKFQAALMLSGEDESAVLERLVTEYAHNVFEGVLGKTGNEEPKSVNPVEVGTNPNEQKRLFVNWFRSLTRNGKPYNPVTISGYTGRIENACSDPIFKSVPIDNLFEIVDLERFLEIRGQIRACEGYAEFDARSHNGFTAALRKYEEFLRLRNTGNYEESPAAVTQPHSRVSNVHRWTMEEDLICCMRFLECYVIQKSDMDITRFLQILSKEVPAVSEGSLRMKIQNIKYLTMREGIKDTAAIKWLSQYSMQCERAFGQAVKELRIR